MSIHFRRCVCPLLCAVILMLAGRAAAVESVNFGYDATLPSATDAIRLSTRIGYAWFSQNQVNTNPENGNQIPYAYHDGYVEQVGIGTFDSVYAKNRWKSILDGNGDPYTGATGAQIGRPTIIILDEVNTNFTDSGQGPALRNALSSFVATTGYTRANIAMLFGPSLSMGTGVVGSNYTKIKEAANNFVRFTCLEVYVTQQGFLTGYDPGDPVYRNTGDTYLANRLTFGIRNWTTTIGLDATRVRPMIQIDNRAAQGSNNDFYQFMNRCFWFMANGWYNAAHSGVDANIKTALRGGVGSYTWAPGSGLDQLTPNANRDTYFEKYEWFYCTNGALSAFGWRASASLAERSLQLNLFLRATLTLRGSPSPCALKAVIFPDSRGNPPVRYGAPPSEPIHPRRCFAYDHRHRLPR